MVFEISLARTSFFSIEDGGCNLPPLLLRPHAVGGDQDPAVELKAYARGRDPTWLCRGYDCASAVSSASTVTPPIDARWKQLGFDRTTEPL